MSHETIIERWLDTLEGRTDVRGRRLQNYRGGSNVYGEGDTLYSYGRHFPLVEWYPNGRGRRTPLFLLNGDRVSVTTSRHQSDARSAIGRRARDLGAHVLIVPFSALTGAGILRDTIRPLEIRPDRFETVAERPVPAGIDLADVNTAHETRTCPVPDYRPLGMRDETRPDMTVYTWRAAGYVFERRDYNEGNGPGAPRVVENPPGEPSQLDGYSRLYSQRHLLGDSLFTAETVERRRIVRPISVSDVVRAAVRSIELRRRESRGILDVVETLDNVDVDAPIVETVDVRRRRRYVSSFDMNEPAPLYFLATLPNASRAQTVASAIDDLAPAAVHAAIARGRHVERQGDIFAIETDTHDAALAGYPRARLTLETRGARPRPGEPGYAAPLTADEVRRIRRRARALWRKRWTVPALEPVSPKGMRDAVRRRMREASRSVETNRRAGRRALLAPHTADDRRYWYSRNPVADRMARAREAQGYARAQLAEARQYRGTIRDTYRGRSAIVPGERALYLWRQCVTDATHELRPAMRADRLERARRETRAILSIHGTAHTATEVVRAPGGRVYIRGAMIHEPRIIGERRERDHIRRALKPGVWYLAVRNTVPRASADTNGARR